MEVDGGLPSSKTEYIPGVCTAPRFYRLDRNGNGFPRKVLFLGLPPTFQDGHCSGKQQATKHQATKPMPFWGVQTPEKQDMLASLGRHGLPHVLSLLVFFLLAVWNQGGICVPGPPEERFLDSGFDPQGFGVPKQLSWGSRLVGTYSWGLLIGVQRPKQGSPGGGGEI